VIWQSAVGHDWGRSKTANQAFVTTPRWVRLLASHDEGFEKEVKLRTRLLSQYPAGWGCWQGHDEGFEKEVKPRTRLLSQHPSGWGSRQSHDEGFEKEEKLRTRLLYQGFASISSAFHCERNKSGLLL